MSVVVRPSWLNPKITIKQSAIAQVGMIATECIRTGEVVVVFGGPYADTEGAQLAIQHGKGVMQWDEDVWSIEAEGDDPVYRINHSCAPNTWMLDVFTLVARTEIQPGQEVTADYALWEANEDYVSAWTCGCGTPQCRGRVTGRDWRLPQLQREYAGHFSPLLNRRILTAV
ncbi:MAG: SET domain-containing protein-lysine N-methyltransferase [Anaerolineae bacterium]